MSAIPMSAILFAAHADDEALFSAYTCIRFAPFVVCCTKPKEPQRLFEFHQSCGVLGCYGEMWDEPEGAIREPSLRESMEALRDMEPGLFAEETAVYAPAHEDGGHDEHNLVASLAVEVFGDSVRHYLTYRRGSGRTRGHLAPREASWPGIKLRAMACYQSQIAQLSTRPWFESDWIDEWYA